MHRQICACYLHACKHMHYLYNFILSHIFHNINVITSNISTLQKFHIQKCWTHLLAVSYAAFLWRTNATSIVTLRRHKKCRLLQFVTLWRQHYGHLPPFSEAQEWSSKWCALHFYAIVENCAIFHNNRRNWVFLSSLFSFM